MQQAWHKTSILERQVFGGREKKHSENGFVSFNPGISECFVPNARFEDVLTIQHVSSRYSGFVVASRCLPGKWRNFSCMKAGKNNSAVLHGGRGARDLAITCGE